ncbi:hypothetical protein L9F63_028201 [Diploptera punctata]|uniref:Uncharacterized protein n=1 Tax=Diploptera punctata TaxID=6984 RepID=A0AAD7ZW30_DIPPU|nr:hypothetical protein L9F63_028201 [Diploptera punctata]
MRGKPKILIIQACQGKAHQDVLSHDDISSDGPEIRGVSADFITFWSTVPGYASFRHEIQGTWFIQALCRIFLGERFTDNVVTLFTQVNGDVSCQRTVIRGACKTMVSQFQSTLVGELNLPLRSEKQLDVSLRMFPETHVHSSTVGSTSRESRKIAAEKRRKKTQVRTIIRQFNVKQPVNRSQFVHQMFDSEMNGSLELLVTTSS